MFLSELLDQAALYCLNLVTKNRQVGMVLGLRKDKHEYKVLWQVLDEKTELRKKYRSSTQQGTVGSLSEFKVHLLEPALTMF